MKRTVFIIFFMIYSVSLDAQIWSPAGATWHYDYPTGGYYKITYLTDTLINSIICNKLEKKLVFNDPWEGDTDTAISYEFTYSDTDKIYLYRFNSFQVLYDFSVNVGDTLLVPGNSQYTGCDSTGLVKVDTTGTMVLNSETLRYYSVHNLSSSNWGWNCRIVEKIGPVYNFSGPSVSYMLPFKFDFCGMIPDEPKEGGSFRCYSDDNFPVYSVSANPCDFVIGINEKSDINLLSVFPNPNTGTFQVDFSANLIYNNYKLELFNLQGIQVFSSIIPVNGQINARGLNGIFLLRITNDEEHIYHAKIVISNQH